MYRLIWVSCIGAMVAIAVLQSSISAPQSVVASDAEEKQPVRRAFGIDKRELWTTSKVQGSPEPPAPYQIARSYPKLGFDEPLELVTVPGKKIWVVAERKGKIWTFDGNAKNPDKKLLLDVGHTVYGVVLHPDFAKNGFVFVSHIPNG